MPGSEPCTECGGVGCVDADQLIASQNPNGFIVSTSETCPRCGGSGKEPK